MNKKFFLRCSGRIATVCFLFTVFCSQLYAVDCDLGDADFPSEECSFADLGVNTQMLKFGEVDAAFQINSSNTIVRFGAATFNLPGSAVVYHVIDDDDCDILDGDDLDGISSIGDVAFIPSTTDPRIITDIWVLDCDVVQDR